MANYNYYNNLASRLKKGNTTQQKYKSYTVDKGTFDKSVYDEYNEVKLNSYIPSHGYKPVYGNTQNQRGKTSVRKNHDSPVYGKTDAIYDGGQIYREKPVQPLIRQPLADTFSTREKARVKESDISTDAFKKNVQNQWYNKIAHGSFKEDDWFGGMVKNQENAESWYKITYGEKDGKKEYNALHNRLVTTPYDKVKEEEKQFVNYNAVDFKVPELKLAEYKLSSVGDGASKKETDNIGNREQATSVIKQNANDIRDAAYRHGVDPVIVAACIYGEQALNYDWKDKYIDEHAYFANTSIGVGQVRISTAKELEDFGYVEPVKYVGDVREWHGNGFVKKQKWSIPGYGVVIVYNREQAIAKRLTIDSECINYVAAYVASLQKSWEWAYPDIYQDTAITATLYNQGVGNPKANPKPNEFGEFIRENYEYINDIYHQYLK